MKQFHPFLHKGLLVLVFLLSSACTQAIPNPTSTPSAESQPTVGFLNISKQTQPSQTKPATLEATEAPTPAHTPVPTYTSIPVVIVTQANSGCTNQAEFVKHLTVSYNSAIKPGEYFTKIWQIRNTGTCTWSTDYRLVMIGGEPMQAPETIQLTQEVKPQESLDLRVNLVAPETPDFYENSWMLQDQDGNFFGFGTQHDEPLMVKIQVPQIFKPKPI